MPFVTYTWPAAFDRLSVDHGYMLYSALSHALPSVHEGSWQVCPIAGSAVGGSLHGPGHLRLRGPLAPVMLDALNGGELRVGSGLVKLGRGTVSQVKPSPTLEARIVTIKNADTADRLLAHVAERIHALIEHIPEITIGARRVMQISNRKIVGFGVTISGLDSGDSLAVQTSGIGGRRRMGAGVFEAVERESKIGGRWFFTPHAVRQFIDRYGVAVGARGYNDALAWMAIDSASARKIHDARGGGEVWVGRRPWRVRYVVAEQESCRLPAVVTVLSNSRRTAAAC